jgi:hypothetical protein
MKIFNKKQVIEKTTKEIIEEIHETFYSEVDKLLLEAKIMNTIETDRQPLLDKSIRLEKIGFGQSKECKEAKKEIERLDKLKLENLNKETLIEAINYFSFKYPQYKFITEDSVKKICEKYNLIYGSVGRYTGEIPTKNLEDMEKFSISDEDKCYLMITRYMSMYSSESIKIINYKDFHDYHNPPKKEYNDYISGMRMFDTLGRLHTNCKAAPLEIAAPLKDFNTVGMEIKNKQLCKIEIPDPVVLQPIYFKGIKHYLIMTAWGEEGSDELVINQKMN